MNTKHRALTGFNYGPESTRVDAGDVVTDLPDDVASSLLEAGVLEAVQTPSPADLKPKAVK